MKLFNYSLYLLLSLSILLNACKKSDTPFTNWNAKSYKIIDGRVAFSSRETYEAFVSSKSDNIITTAFKSIREDASFHPMKSIRKLTTTSASPRNSRLADDSTEADDPITQEDIDEIVDDLSDSTNPLGAVINSDGVIQIDSLLYKIDFWGDKVFTLQAGRNGSVTSTDYNDLVNGNRTNYKIGEFTTDDEVFEYVALGFTSKDQYNGCINCIGFFCFNSGAPRKTDKGKEYYDPNDNDYRLDCSVVYQKAGIYFSLQSKVKSQKKGIFGIWFSHETNLRLTYYSIYTVRCPRNEFGPNQGFIESDKGNNKHELNYRPYTSSKGLTKYQLVSVYEKLNDFPASNFITRNYEIKSGY